MVEVINKELDFKVTIKSLLTTKLDELPKIYQNVIGYFKNEIEKSLDEATKKKFENEDSSSVEFNVDDKKLSIDYPSIFLQHFGHKRNQTEGLQEKMCTIIGDADLKNKNIIKFLADLKDFTLKNNLPINCMMRIIPLDLIEIFKKIKSHDYNGSLGATFRNNCKIRYSFSKKDINKLFDFLIKNFEQNSDAKFKEAIERINAINKILGCSELKILSNKNKQDIHEILKIKENSDDTLLSNINEYLLKKCAEKTHDSKKGIQIDSIQTAYSLLCDLSEVKTKSKQNRNIIIEKNKLIQIEMFQIVLIQMLDFLNDNTSTKSTYDESSFKILEILKKYNNNKIDSTEAVRQIRNEFDLTSIIKKTSIYNTFYNLLNTFYYFKAKKDFELTELFSDLKSINIVPVKLDSINENNFKHCSANIEKLLINLSSKVEKILKEENEEANNYYFDKESNLKKVMIEFSLNDKPSITFLFDYPLFLLECSKDDLSRIYSKLFNTKIDNLESALINDLWLIPKFYYDRLNSIKNHFDIFKLFNLHSKLTK